MKNDKFYSELHTYFKITNLEARGIKARWLSDCAEGSWRD
jgi:hypothetical protein